MTVDWRKKTRAFFDCTELSSAGTVRAVDSAYGLVGTAQLILVNIQSGAVENRASFGKVVLCTLMAFDWRKKKESVFRLHRVEQCWHR